MPAPFRPQKHPQSFILEQNNMPIALK